MVMLTYTVFGLTEQLVEKIHPDFFSGMKCNKRISRVLMNISFV